MRQIVRVVLALLFVSFPAFAEAEIIRLQCSHDWAKAEIVDIDLERRAFKFIRVRGQGSLDELNSDRIDFHARRDAETSMWYHIDRNDGTLSVNVYFTIDGKVNRTPSVLSGECKKIERKVQGF